MIVVDPIYGCWLWQGPRDKDGYGVYHGRGVHRIAYELTHGAIPDGVELDHLCRRRECCHPGHLELVTRRANVQRRKWSRRARRAKCPAGHDLHIHGRRTPEGGHACRRCSSLHSAELLEGWLLAQERAR